MAANEVAKVIVDKPDLDALADSISAKSGVSGKKTVAQMKATVDNMSGMGVDPLITFDAENDGVTDYLEDAEAYTDADDLTTSVMVPDHSSGYDKPSRSALAVPANASVIYWADENTGDGWSESVSAGTYYVKNLVPGHSYFFRIDDSSGNVLKAGRYTATGGVRMIWLSSNVHNFRDLGGWSCDGGTVKYGKLIRGAQLNYKNSSDQIVPLYTAADIIQLHDVLKIRHEIDMRSYSSAGTPIGDDVKYSYYQLSDNTYVENLGTQNLTDVIKTIIDNVIYDRPTYFHCSVGADRTGLISFIVMAVLGVHRYDIDKDYELTSFYTISDNPQNYTRLRTDSRYKTLATRFAPANGVSFRDMVIQWIVDQGISVEKLNAFRNAMIDGNPADLDPADYTLPHAVTYALTNVTKDASAPDTVVDNGSFTATLTCPSGFEITDVTVTMGGVTQSGAFTPLSDTVGEVTIAAVTGALAISAVAKKEVLTAAGYTAGERLSATTGEVKSGASSQLTGFFPAVNGNTVELVNISNLDTAADGSLPVYAFYDENQNFLWASRISCVTNTAGNLDRYVTTPAGGAIGNYPSSFKIKNTILYSADVASPVAYMRISCSGITANSKIYIS